MKVPAVSHLIEASDTEPLAIDEVHVWHANLDDLASALPVFRLVLSADESERAERYHFKRDRDRFIAGRGALRHVLSKYAGHPPERIRIHYRPHGKPTLAAGHDIHFNLTHSQELVMCIVARGREVGIDVERIVDTGDLDVLAGHYFSPREHAAYRGLSEPEKPDAFFACWTRKEAFIKALGCGLSMPLSLFDVTFGPNEQAAVVRFEHDREAASRWFMADVSPQPGFRAAVAVDGPFRMAMRRFGITPTSAPEPPERADGRERAPVASRGMWA